MLSHAALAELLGGSARFRALRRLHEEPQRAFGTRELAAEAGIDPGNASRWLRRWADVGLIERVTERGVVLFRAASDPSLAPLADLLRQNSRIAETVGERVASIKDISAAAIFGSVASGETHAASDIDLLLVTNLSRLKAQAMFKSLGRELGRPINVLTYAPAAWRSALDKQDAFVAELLAHPLILLKGDLNATAKT